MLRRVKMTQKTIFEAITEAEKRKQEGMELSFKNAESPWIEAVRERMQEIIATKHTFTADDVLIPIENKGIFTKTNSALGAIIKAFERAGYIKATSMFKESIRPSRHRAPLRIWEVVA